MTAVSERSQLDLAGLVREYQADVWRRLRFLGATPEEADDLTQETFLAVARSPMEQRCPRQTRGYLHTAARNQLLMLRRRQGRQVNTVDLTAAEHVWAELVPGDDAGVLLDALAECYEQTAGRARDALDRFYGDDLGRAEVASRLQMTVDGVKTLLQRTRKALRECIERRLQATQR